MNASRRDKVESVWAGDRTCPVCAHSEFGIVDETFALVQLEGSEQNKTYVRLEESGDIRFYPLVLAMCTNCGYTVLFNARQIGVIRPSDE